MTAKDALLEIEECFTNFYSILDNESPKFFSKFYYTQDQISAI